MKNSLLFVLVVPLAFLLAGCPYESAVPIDVPGIKIDPAMLGTWQDPTDTTTVYKVSKKDAFTARITQSHTGSTETQDFLGYTSIVNGSTFLNIWQDLPGTDPVYQLYKMNSKDDHTFTLAEVTDNIDEVFTSSAELKSFISANMKNSYFFGKDESEYVKIGK